MTPEQILKQFEKLDADLYTAIEKLLGTNPSQQELLQFLASPEFDAMIEEKLGLRNIISEYVAGFDIKLQSSGYTQLELKAQQIERISANVELVKNSYGRTVLGYAKANSQLLRTKLIASIVGGVDSKQTLEQLKTIPLTTSQLGTVVNTSYADYSRVLTAEVFKDKPEQRFEYVGGVLPTSSDECQWLVTNQKPEGYTKKEIDAGIETPFTHTSGSLTGQKKMIYWDGRQPNYNCIHTWMPKG